MTAAVHATVEDKLRSAVLRVEHASNAGGVLGTAFAIGPNLALTCAHVVRSWPTTGFRLIGEAVDVEVTEVRLPPDPEQVDLALLQITDPLPVMLACASEITVPKQLIARGYSPDDVGSGGRELRFDPRHLTRAAYDSVRLEDAFDLAGDLAESGFSGAPLVDCESAAVVGVISGGDSSRGRSWAVRFGGTQWDEFELALERNCDMVPRYGPLVNRLGAHELCAAQVGAAIGKMQERGQFNPEWLVPRSAISDAAKFAASKYSILAYAGPSNVGKTWLLCQLALNAGSSPCVFLAAADLDQAAPPKFPDFLQASLSAAWRTLHGSDGPAIPDPTALAVACVNPPLTVLLDGLNEALDVWKFQSRWWPDAVAWCRKYSVRLIVSSRAERWPAFARAVPNPHETLYIGDASRTDQSPPIEQRAVTVSDFSVDEALEAASSYRVSSEIREGIGHHPLLFRVAHDLNPGAAEARSGRFRLLDAFILRRVDAALEGKPRAIPERLHVALHRLAESVGADGSVAWDAAEQIAGSPESLEALVAGGLLIPAGKFRVRFTYDQLADVLRPVPADVAAPFRIIGNKGADPGVLRAAATGMLRLEADGDEEAFSTGFEVLLSALQRLQSLEKSNVYVELRQLDVAIQICQALPSTRVAQIERVYRALCDLAPHFVKYGGLEFQILLDWLVNAPLPAALHAQILLSVVPFCRVWPFRWGDWSTPYLYPAFAASVKKRGVHVAYDLDRLHAADPVAVRPLLIDALSNRTLMDRDESDSDRGRADVSSFAAGLLFHRRHEALPSLLDALAEQRGSDSDGIVRLCIEIGRHDANEICARLAERLSRSKSDLLVRNASLVLRDIVPRLSGPMLDYVTEPLRRIFAEAEPSVAIEVAKTLRTAGSTDPTVWDWLAEAARNGTLDDGRFLSPIPDGRLTAACDLVRCNVAVGLKMIEKHDGPVNEQLVLAALADELLDAGRLTPFLFGRLTEDKLYLLLDDSRYRPWMALAQRILCELKDESARTCMIYALFHPASLNNADIRELARTALRETLTVTERCLIATLLYGDRNQYNGVDLFDMLRSARTSASQVVDRALIFDHYCQISSELIEFWQSLPLEEQSPLSAAVVKAIHEGSAPDQIESLELLRHLGE